ncbi:hypothetical protein BS50DRAFT_168196 [Corynespora cassiicola Philippines]|uniref:Uncharacterized protein n=1 Tax=Corynespora cassiicola Philippines TaxID=1448308 RepID=A0A2T2P5J9_CORCC|nr:hypothetical protein BS50DRAFT_168196 [Corynespora cassiicola Philippines]
MFRISSFFLAVAIIAPFSYSIKVDCSMSETTRCDCIYSPDPPWTMAGTDCRVCRVEGQLMCVLWGSPGTRYGPLCEEQECPNGSSWEDGNNTPGNCHCDWQPKEHERIPCPTPAGDCKCSHVIHHSTETSTSTLPGETCMVCPDTSNGPYRCTEPGNRMNRFGPLCTGPELGLECTGKSCICNWMTTTAGEAWKNETV